MGCRCGSIETSWHTSVSREAVMSLTSLCLIDGYPPVGHDRACAMLNAWPQLQCDGEFLIAQPYRRERASRNAVLWRAKPWLSMGSAVSHVDAPFSWDSSMLRWRGAGSCSCYSWLTALACCASRCELRPLFAEKGWFQGEPYDPYIRHSLNPSSTLPDTGCTPKPIHRPYTQTFPPTAGRQRASEIRTHGNSA